MAPSEGFSIREYAAKMRSVDVLKSFPFVVDDMSREEAESLLPPITVTKFKMWSCELSRIKEETFITVVNRESNEEIPLNDTRFVAVEEDEKAPSGCDNRRVVLSSMVKKGCVFNNKGKPKAPKKRSIAEIFAVSPLIRTVHFTNKDEDEDEDEDEERLVDCVARKLKGKKVKKRKKDMKVVIMKDTNFNNNKINKMKNKKQINKENSCKLKQKNTVNFAKKLHKKVAVNDSDVVAGRARTQNVNYLSTRKRKGAETSRIIPKQKKPVTPTLSILKNHVLCRQKSATYRTEGDGQDNTCGFQHSRRQVRFSGKDDVLGPRKNEKSPSSEKDQSIESEKDASPIEVDRREGNVSVGTDNIAEACSNIGRKENPKLLDHVDLPSFLRPHITHLEKAKHLAAKSLPSTKVAAIPDDNRHMLNQGYLTTESETACAGVLRPTTAVENSCGDYQGVTASRAFGSSSHKIDRYARPNTKENTGAFFEPSIHNFISNENAQERVQFRPQYEGDRISDHCLQYQSVCPPMGILGGSYPFPQIKQRPATFTERILDDKFYGLPINSHGELMQYSSKGGFQQPGKLNPFVGSSISLPAYSQHFVESELPSHQLNLFPMQNYMRENCGAHFPDRSGITYSGIAQRPDMHQLDFDSRNRHSYSFHPRSELDLFSISSSRFRQFETLSNDNIGRLVPKETSCRMPCNMNQPTMRLMGKDVTVGNSSRQIHAFDDGRVWMDKEIIAEHCPSRNALLNSTMNKNFHQNFYPSTTSEKLKASFSQSVGICSEQAAQSNLWTQSTELRFPHPYHKWHNMEFEHGSHTTSKTPMSSYRHFLQSPSAVFNGEHNFRAPSLSRTESLQSQLFGSQLPVLPSPQVIYERGIFRPTEAGYKQHQPQFRKSAFDFPFLNSEFQENVRPSWFQSSSKAGLPPWLLHATLERSPPVTAAQVFPNSGSKHMHRIMHKDSILNAPSVHYSSNISHSKVKKLPYPQNAIVQVVPEQNPGSAMIDSSFRDRMDLKDRMKSTNIGIKDLYPCKRIKRSAVDDSTNPPDIIDLEVQEKSSVVTAADFIDEMQSNFRALDLESSPKQVNDPDCITQKDEISSLHTETSKADETGRSGPVKLSAGAKHIIKPTLNVDQDNCRSLHSTIPFVAVTNGYTRPEPQTRSTKIYKF